MRSRHRGCGDGQAGFSLVEAMIAVAVIALLLAMAVPSYNSARNKSRIERATAELEMLAGAIRQLSWDTGRWPNRAMITSPGSTEVWDVRATTSGLLTYHATYGSAWKGPYLRSINLDPWGKAYFFDPDYTTGGKVRIVVGSFGPNKVGRNVYDKDDIIIVLK